MANTPVERKLEEVLDAIDTILEDCNEVLASKGKPPIHVIADLPDAVEGGIESSASVDTDKGLGIEVIEEEEYIYVKVDNSTIKFNANGQLYADISGLEIITANELPTASASTMGKLYLVPSASSKTQNVKDEYITIQSGSSYDWEQIGSTAIDLTDYATKAWVEAKGYALDSDLADVAKSGDYEDLINTPTIPVLVQSDWNETDTTDPAYIQNKPTIPPSAVVDDALSMTSTNPVQNKVITSKISTVIGVPQDPSQTPVNFIFNQELPINKPSANGKLMSGFLHRTSNDSYYFELVLEPSETYESEFSNIIFALTCADIYSNTVTRTNILTLKTGYTGANYSFYHFKYSLYIYNTSGTLAYSLVNNAVSSQKTDTYKYNSWCYITFGAAYWTNVINNVDKATIIDGEINSGSIAISSIYLADRVPLVFNYTINGDPPKSPWEQLQDRVTNLEQHSTEQIQSDWNQIDTTAVDYIKNKPTIPAETPIATTSVAGIVKPDGTSITVDGNGEIKAPNTSIDITNRFNQIFGDNTPPSPPEFPPVKTNFVLPSNDLPMIKGYDTSFSIFTVDANGNPYYYEVYLDVPAGVIIHGIAFKNTDYFYFIVSNTNSSDVNLEHIYFDKYNATTGNKEITQGIISSLGGNSIINANASQLSLSMYEHGQLNLYNSEYYYNISNIPLITSGTFNNTKQWTGQITARPINNNWQYTINAGSTDTTPWEEVKEKAESALTSIPNASASIVGGVKAYYDSTTGTLYLTNDGSDPTPSNE